jgi:hypothetical protein
MVHYLTQSPSRRYTALFVSLGAAGVAIGWIADDVRRQSPLRG